MSEKKERILVFAPNSWIAGKFLSFLEKHPVPIWSLYLSPARLNNLAEVTAALDKFQPSTVINFGGRVRTAKHNTIDGLESVEGQLVSVQDNILAPLLVANECAKRNIYCVVWGTGCIYNSTPSEPPILDHAKPNFDGSIYSFCKGLTDQVLTRIFREETLNLRIRMPVSDDLDCKGILGKVKHYKKLHNIQNSMTVLRDVFPIVIDLIKRKITGPINVVNPGHIDLITIRKKMVHYNLVSPMDECEYTFSNRDEMMKSTVAPRSNNILSTARLELLGYSLPSIHTSIEETLTQLQTKQ